MGTPLLIGGAAAAAVSKQPARKAPEVRGGPLAIDMGSEVRAADGTIGTVNAHFSTQQMFRRVLSGGRRRQGEISFVIDADGAVHTLNQADRKRLESIGIAAADSDAMKQAATIASKDWVVVKRKDEDSDVTFGIARPISQPLREIRNTAARNLGFGLGIIGLALIGIIPLSHHMTRNIAALAEGAEQLALGNFHARVEVKSRDEIGRLAGTFNRMAHDLSEHQKQLVEQERMRKELEMSRRIQEEMLPKRPLHAGPVDIKGVSMPAREVGGDFFNYFHLPHGEIAILVGDVSGKGVAAALLMANLQATLQARLPLVSDLAELARQLDTEIHANTPPEAYLSLFMSILNPADNMLRYVNAGHHTQYLLHNDGTVVGLPSTGRPLGLWPGGDYQECRVSVAAGDAMFLYTDGLVEAENADGQEFGHERLEAILVEAHRKGVTEILACVEQENRRHRGSIEPLDDATMLILTVSPDSTQALEA